MEPIGDYEYSKKDLIGHGAFAVVFKGRKKKRHDHTVAIKCITKKNLAKSQNLLSKEIKILKELSDLHHENVVALLDCKETPHHVYLVMEYCNGGDLADYLQVKHTLSEDTIALFLRQIAGAMRALDAKGIVHRDLKPQNILLNHAGKTQNPPPSDIEIKIADFGFARFLQDGVMAATLCGSPMYMAPEVIMSLQYDAKADLWSVGTMVYQCLTGKAPFQAQTPQQLKQFYERNANLAPNIPSGTSPELRNLLNGLLKRNAKDRMDFETFFRHPFHCPQAKSSPVPVPRSRSRSSMGESPPVKTVSASPLSGNVYMSPPQTVPVCKPKEPSQEPMEVGTPPGAQPKAGGKELPRHTPTEDFVMVPDNIPSDHSVSSNGSSQRPPSSVDLNAIFSDASPDSPRHVPKTVRPGPYSRTKGGEAIPGETGTVRKASPPHLCGISPRGGSPRGSSPGVGAEGGASSPSRPSSLPVLTPPQSSPSSEPIPVPSQVKAYEQIQRSTGGYSPGSVSPHKLNSPGSGVGRSSSPPGVPIPRRVSNTNLPSVPSVGSMSPPQVQFTIGTPPSHGWNKRQGTSGVQTTTNNNSPLRRQSSRSSTPNLTQAGLSTLPTILGSPTKTPLGPGFPVHEGTDRVSPSSPLQTPFGKGLRTRIRTCPDNIAAVGYSPNENIEPIAEYHNQIVPVSSATQVGSTSKLSEQLLKAAFGGQIPSPPLNVFGAQFSASPGSLGTMVPYSGSNTSLHQVASSGSLRERADLGSNRARRASGSEDVVTGNVPPFTLSPPNMEGPIMFIAPELVEETLMDPEHNETVSKLNFVLALVECIIELAQSRSSPLSESVIDQKPTSTFTLDHITFISESQRRMEQLVLYVRALQLLSSSISLAKEEIKTGRLHPSNTVRNILKEMNDYYRQCLNVCKHLHNKGVGQNLESDPQAAAVTADKLIYSYAIEMCQTAALDELFGNPQECFRRYRNAQILLHSLAQQAHCETDRMLLNKYKESVEKRLFQLHTSSYDENSS